MGRTPEHPRSPAPFSLKGITPMSSTDERTQERPKGQTLSEALDKIERVRQARRQKFHLRDDRITLSHGSGGKATHNLIEGVFAPAFSNPLLDAMDDAAILITGATTHQSLAFTTDSYVVSPLLF